MNSESQSTACAFSSQRAFCPSLLCRTAPSTQRLNLKVADTESRCECRKQSVLSTWDRWRHQQSRTGGASVLRVPGPGCQLGHCREILPYSAFWETGCIQSASIQKVFEAFDGCLSPFLEMLPPCGTQGLQRVLEGSYGSAPRWRSSSNIYSYTSIIRVESFLWAQGKLQWTLWTVCYFRICGISLHSAENKLMWVSCLKGRKTFFFLNKKKK